MKLYLFLSKKSRIMIYFDYNVKLSNQNMCYIFLTNFIRLINTYFKLILHLLFFLLCLIYEQ